MRIKTAETRTIEIKTTGMKMRMMSRKGLSDRRGE